MTTRLNLTLGRSLRWIYMASISITFFALVAPVQASVPPFDPHFKPSTQEFSGPDTIRFSGFCLTLRTGETAARSQGNQWSNSTLAKLSAGKLVISENGSGGAPQIGKRFRKVNGGWLLKAREDGHLVYYYYNGMPGTTALTFDRKTGRQNIDPVLGRLAFGAC